MSVPPVHVRFICEGLTEVNFVTDVLGPHLKAKGVTSNSIDLRGIVPFETLRKNIKLAVGKSKRHEFTTTMLDLYKIGKYPFAKERGPTEPLLDWVRRIEAGMADRLPNSRFIPYVQVHEFEAILFVQPEAIEARFPDDVKARGAGARLRASAGSLAPEEIDDGEATAPSKRIIQAIPAYKDRKATVGPRAARAIGLPAIRAACPHFDSWVTRLENLKPRD